MAAVVAQVVEVVVTAILAAVHAGKRWREAAALSLREAADKIEAGELLVEDAVERAREDQVAIDSLYGSREA